MTSTAKDLEWGKIEPGVKLMEGEREDGIDATDLHHHCTVKRVTSKGQNTSFDSTPEPVCDHYDCHITVTLMDSSRRRPELPLHYGAVAWLWLMAQGARVMDERV